jgi:CTP:phosphocholine cytidylyltransferase-like protein
MKRKKYVIAGNFRQYVKFLYDNKLNRNEVIYLGSENSIRGLCIEKSDIIRYGTWYKRNDIKEIERMIKECIIPKRDEINKKSMWDKLIKRVRMAFNIIVKKIKKGEK